MSNSKKTNSAKQIKVSQVKSASGSTEKIIATLKGLGLGRIGKSKTLEDTNSVRGMVNKVHHLIKVEQI